MSEVIKRDPINIVQILKQSWRLYRENAFLFIGIFAIGQALSMSLAFLTFVSTATNLGFTVLMALPASLITMWAMIALVIALASRYADKTIVLKEAFKAARGKYWRYLWISIQFNLIFAGGFLLLIVPGFYWGIIYSLAPILVVLETRRDIGPFRLSQKLIRNSFWIVLLLMAIVGAPSLLLLPVMAVNQQIYALLSHAFSIVYIPFVTAVQVMLYYQLKERSQTELIPEVGIDQ